MTDLKDIEEVLSTGISRDYIRSFGPLNLFFRSVYDQFTPSRIKHFARSNLQKHYFYKYTEWFDPSTYREVITEKNSLGVSQLDEIVDELNGFVKEKKIEVVSENPQDYRTLQLFDNAMGIIFGKFFYDKSMCKIAADPKLFNYYFSAGA